MEAKPVVSNNCSRDLRNPASLFYNDRSTKTALKKSLYTVPPINKKIELMFTRRAKAYSSSGSVV